MVEGLGVFLFVLLGACIVVAPVVIFLPRLIGSIFLVQVRTDFKKHWVANFFLSIATIASITLFVWLYQRNH
jgi:uncharacterized membrane protein AbrB (regulator of aidB expression)